MIVTVDINELDAKTLETLIEGTRDEKLLDELYKIDFKKIAYVFSQKDIHRKMIQNHNASKELINIIYKRYSNDSEMQHLILLNPSTPEDIFVDILQNYVKRFGHFGYLSREFLYNEYLTDKAISLVYDLYKEEVLKLQQTTYNQMLEDERTSADVLLDALKNDPSDETICVIATHPNIKIVPASE